MTPPARCSRAFATKVTLSATSNSRVAPSTQRHVEPYHPKPATPRPRSKSPAAVRRPAVVTSTPVPTVIRSGPIPGAVARTKYVSQLNLYEQKEVLKYQEVYFIGLLSKKVKTNNSAGVNYGFDFASHHYRANPGDHIAYRYEIRSVLGKGAFGQVLKCYDHKTKTDVAIKVLINTHQMEQQGKAEMAILKTLNDSDEKGTSHIVKLLETFVFRNHICAVFEVLGQNLYEFSRANMFKAMPVRQVRVIARQMLRALSLIHEQGYVHCDMKPENILLMPGSTTKVRVIDFGSACRIGQKHFDYIQSRFYRAPEVILGMKYGPPIDIWSFACIVAELIGGKPLFSGASEQQQLQLHMAILGCPPKSFIAKAPRKSTFFDDQNNPKLPTTKRHAPGSSTIAKATHCSDPELLDLLDKCLKWDPDQRLTAKNALKHPFFASKEAQPAAAPAPAQKPAAPRSTASKPLTTHTRTTKASATTARKSSPRRQLAPRWH